ncbi:chemotaxis protein CheA [Virgibacillus sp. MG-45]|uniref:chemotaxis protein CheA n=1 Tax=Virgibacillus sp. MG-45 TaxID=3102791 RepID=UPI002ED9C498
MDTDQYIEVFLDESREHLQAVNDNLLKLEKEPENIGIVNDIFRSAHTLKGMAATMGFEDIASLTHKMENVLDKMRNNELNVTADVIDVTFTAVEYLEEMTNEISEGNSGKKDVTELVARLDSIENGTNMEKTVSKEHQAVSNEIDLDEYQLTVIKQALDQGYKPYHIQVQLEDKCVLKGARAYMVFELLENAGDVIKTYPTVEEIEEGTFEDGFSIAFLSQLEDSEIKAMIFNVSEIKDVIITSLSLEATDKKKEEIKETASTNEQLEQKTTDTSKKSNGSKTIRVNLERIEHLMNLFEEIVIDRSRLEDHAQKIKSHELTETVEHISYVAENMQNIILSMRMVPVEQVFNRFPRMVRGLAKDLGKEINLQLVGVDTELDRTVIDEIGDPLVHLIRNSIDHGIETPDLRKQAGKSTEGTLTLRAYHSGNHVFIDIEDDGAGINREKVLEKAIEKGLVTKEQGRELSDDEVFPYIMASGFSTADQISDISGRGVGLDVVKSKIESLGGSITIESEKGKGSIFSIQLPLTLSILSTLLVEVKAEIFAIPLSSIMETLVISESEMMYVSGQKVIDFRGHVVPIVALGEVFSVPEYDNENAKEHAIVIVKKGEKLTGFIVDSFIGQKEVVLKSLGEYLGDVRGISGATILGDGNVALIIDANALIK